MRPVYLPMAAAISLAAACAVAPAESVSTANQIVLNRITLNGMATSRVMANRIVTKSIISGELSAGAMAVNMGTAAQMLVDPDGREVFSAIVGCALPEDVVLTATVGGTPLEFPGELGLAPEWLRGPLDRTGQGWVSACMFARINARDVAIPVSMRGPNLALDANGDERNDWSLEEGAFFGNFFGPADQPVQWYACRGRDQAAGKGGTLSNRLCAVPDPNRPGFTLCGMIFAGDCGSFATDRACEGFSQRGTFYQRCHPKPLSRPCGHLSGDDRAETRLVAANSLTVAFDQVITTFVTP